MANHQLAPKQIPPSRTTELSQSSPKQPPITPKSSGLREARSDRQQKEHAAKMRVNPVILSIQKHPLVIWSTLWVAMLAAGGLAIMGLTNPGHVEPADSLPETTTTQNQNTVLQTQTSDRTPAWMYAAIAIGCATGGWVVLKQLKGSRRRRLLRKPLKQRPTSRRSLPPQKQKAPIQQKQKAPAQQKQKAPTQQKQKSTTPTRQQLPNRRRRAGKSSPPQLPVPPSQMKIAVGQTQLPYTEESQNRLANSMDLRKRQPLSSLLRNR